MRWLFRLIGEIINIIFSITIAILVFFVIRHYLVQPFQVEGHSMDYTLKDGSQMLLYKMSTIERFDVVVFPDPMGSGQGYVKRVIGMPGDTIEMVEDKLVLNGIPLEEPYLEPLQSETPTLFTDNFTLWDTIGTNTIPEGYYFVMGDNRPGSGDSRQFGLVPIDSIQGETNFVYYPFDLMGKIKEYQLNDIGQIVER